MKRPLSLVICFLVPILILLSGIVFSVLFAVQTIPSAFKDEVRGILPGSFPAKLEQPQRYMIWGYSVGRLEGENYQCPVPDLKAANITIIDRRSGKNLPLNDWMPGTRNTSKESAILLGTFETQFENQEVEFFSKNLTSKAVIGISSKSFADMFRAVLSIIAIFLISVFFAITALIVLLHRRQKQIAAFES